MKEKWIQYGGITSGIQESIPFEECPNCKKFKFRKMRTGHYPKKNKFKFFNTLIIMFTRDCWVWDKPHKKFCSKCNYEEELK